MTSLTKSLENPAIHGTQRCTGRALVACKRRVTEFRLPVSQTASRTFKHFQLAHQGRTLGQRVCSSHKLPSAHTVHPTQVGISRNALRFALLSAQLTGRTAHSQFSLPTLVPDEVYPKATWCFCVFSGVPVFPEAVANPHFIVPDWHKTSDQVYLCGPLPGALHNQKAALKMIQAQIPCGLYTSSVIFQAPPKPCSLFGWDGRLMLCWISFSDIDRRFGVHN